MFGFKIFNMLFCIVLLSGCFGEVEKIKGLNSSKQYVRLSFQGIPHEGAGRDESPLLIAHNIFLEGSIEIFKNNSCSGIPLISVNTVEEPESPTNVEITLPNALSAGRHAFTAKFIPPNQSDDRESISFCSEPIHYILDKTEPILEVTSNHSCTSSVCTLSGDCEAGLSVIVSGVGINGQEVMVACSDSDNDPQNNSNQRSGTFSLELALSSGDGPKKLRVSEEDLAGNIKALSVDLLVNVDIRPPLIRVTSSFYSRSRPYTLEGTCESGLAVTISGTGISSPLTASCDDNDQNLENNANQASGGFHQALTLTSGDGIKNITVSQTDIFLNTSQLLFQIQLSTNVNVPILGFAQGGPMNGGSSTNTNPGLVAAGLSMLTGQIKLYRGGLCGGNALSSTQIMGSGREKALALPSPLSTDGTHIYSIKFIDNSQNPSLCSNRLSFTLDRSVPQVSIKTLGALTHVNRGNYLVSGTCTLNDGSLEVSLKDGEVVLEGPEAPVCRGGGVWSASFNLESANLEQALNASLSVTQTDGAANTHSTSASLSISNCIGTRFLKGKGSEVDPYVLCDIYQLQGMNDNLNAHYVLGQNINAGVTNPSTTDTKGIFGALGFIPIGGVSLGSGIYGNPFRGSLDGKGFTIQGLVIRSSSRYVGPFGLIQGRVVLKNIILNDVDIQSSGEYTGGLVGVGEGDIELKGNRVAGLISTETSRFSYFYTGGLGAFIQGRGEVVDNQISGTVSVLETAQSARSVVGGLLGHGESNLSGSFLVKGNTSSSSVKRLSRGAFSSKVYLGGLMGVAQGKGRSSFTISHNGVTGVLSGLSKGRAEVGGGVGVLNLNEQNISFFFENNYVAITLAYYMNEFIVMGGLIGSIWANGPQSSIKIARNYMAGPISVGIANSGKSKLYGGGVIGNNGSSDVSLTMSDNYTVTSFFASTNSTKHSLNMGGLVGMSYNRNKISSVVRRNYVAGPLGASHEGARPLVGGLFASIYLSTGGPDVLRGNYFDSSKILKNGILVASPSIVGAIHFSPKLVQDCVGGLSTSLFLSSSATGLGICDESNLIPFYRWKTATDIDNADDDDDLLSGVDQESVRYDSDASGTVEASDSYIWNFGTATDYPRLNSHNSNQQSVHIASALLAFNTASVAVSTQGQPLFYDIKDTATSIVISGGEAQGTSVSYQIVDSKNASGDALGAPPTFTSNTIDISSMVAKDEFTLRATFTKGAGQDERSFVQDYRFEK